MTQTQAMITVFLIAIFTLLTRALPFVIFSKPEKTPKYITYLGEVLPYAAIGMLVVYCLKSVEVTASPYGLKELLASAFVVALHLWKRNTLLSIAVGTIFYMIIV